MLTFLTLLLGLTLGARPLAAAVDPSVASAQLRLDGAILAVLSGAPWTASRDVGRALSPHPLEAIARDYGREVGRAVQRVNLAGRAAEVTLRLIGEELGCRAAELSRKAVGESDREEIHLRAG